MGILPLLYFTQHPVFIYARFILLHHPSVKHFLSFGNINETKDHPAILKIVINFCYNYIRGHKIIVEEYS